MNIVLVHPEIPQNTGNIARTCAATGTVLHLIEPLGFSLDDRYLKRAGLDYWHLMEYHVYRDEEEFIQKHPGIRCHRSLQAPIRKIRLHRIHAQGLRSLRQRKRL